MPIALGVIGAGLAARNLHWPALQHLRDRFQIVAVCNRSPEKAESFAAMVGGNPRLTTDYQELLSWPEIEAVDIAVPIVLNAPTTIAALRAGKHVLVEKPIAADVEAARAVIAESRRHPHLVLLVAENVRYEPRLQEARRRIDAGEIGRPVLAAAVVLAPLDPESPYLGTAWRQRPEHLAGFLSDGGVHQTAAIQMVAGPATVVEGLVTSFHPERDPTDTLLANLRFASGAIGHLTYSVGAPQPDTLPLTVYGTDGSLVVQRDHLTLRTAAGEQQVTPADGPSSFELEFLDFNAAITQGKPLDVTPQDTLDDLLLIDAALRSSREGQAIRIQRG